MLVDAARRAVSRSDPERDHVGHGAGCRLDRVPAGLADQLRIERADPGEARLTGDDPGDGLVRRADVRGRRGRGDVGGRQGRGGARGLRRHRTGASGDGHRHQRGNDQEREPGHADHTPGTTIRYRRFRPDPGLSIPSLPFVVASRGE